MADPLHREKFLQMYITAANRPKRRALPGWSRLYRTAKRGWFVNAAAEAAAIAGVPGRAIYHNSQLVLAVA